MDKSNENELYEKESKSVANDNFVETPEIQSLNPPALQLQSEDEKKEEEAQLKSKADFGVASGGINPENSTTQFRSNAHNIPDKPFQLKAEPNNTGLPDQIKLGVENLSGHSLDDVNVHYNSTKPAQLNAHAFAQGTDIHVGPGQEKHLPHEAWHVAQQKQGRVQPTVSKQGVNINDSPFLEKEADTMGEKALQFKARSPLNFSTTAVLSQEIVQGNFDSVLQLSSTPEEFIAHGQYGPKDITPPTNTGGFSAFYNPNSGPDGSLVAYVSTYVDFKNGLSIDASNSVTDNTGGKLSKAVTDIMAMPANRRVLAVAGYQWTEEQKTTHRGLFKTRMEEAMKNWSTSSHGMRFYIDKTDWDHIQASLTCVPLVNETASGIEHIKTQLWKVPDDNSRSTGAFIRTYGGSKGRGNLMSIDSTHTNMTKTKTWLREQVYFKKGKSELTNNAKTKLKNFVMLFQDSSTNNVSNKISLVGRASTKGAKWYNKRLAKKRMKAVKSELMKNVTGPSSGRNFPGFADERIMYDNQGEKGAGEGAEWQRVDIVVGSGEVQNTIMHELGHVFGLKDEYVSDNSEPALKGGTGGVTGQTTKHDEGSHADFADSGADPSTYEMNDNIMSVGNEVRSQHLITFNYALRELTNVHEWKIES